MIGFKNNKILFNSEGLGERFRRTRLDAKIETDKAAADMNINAKYLEFLERGQLRKLPAGIYRKNIVSSYARYLGLDEGEIAGLFAQEDAAECDERRRNVFSRKIPHISYFLPTPKIIRSALLIIVVLVCVGYLGHCFKRIVSPPKLTVFAPDNDVVVSQFNIDIKGTTEPEAEVVINGESVLTDLTGNFIKTVNLKTGLNTILVSAQKKYSQRSSIVKQVLVRGGG
jgi:cytoskeletal protein RodZ